VGVRGIDIDYLSEPGVDQVAVAASLTLLYNVQLKRYLHVQSMLSPEQWAHFESVDPNNFEMRTLKKAAKELRIAFKDTVLVHYKNRVQHDAKS